MDDGLLHSGANPGVPAEQLGDDHLRGASLPQTSTLSMAWSEFAQREGWTSRSAIAHEDHPLTRLLRHSFPTSFSHCTLLEIGTGASGRDGVLVDCRDRNGLYLVPMFVPQLGMIPRKGSAATFSRNVEAFTSPVGVVVESPTPELGGMLPIQAIFTRESFREARRHLLAVETAFQTVDQQYLTSLTLISNVTAPSYLFQHMLKEVHNMLETGKLSSDGKSATVLGLLDFSLRNGPREDSVGILSLVAGIPNAQSKNIPYFKLTVEVQFEFNPFYGIPQIKPKIIGSVNLAA